MSDKLYQVAIILTIPAPDYQSAISKAQNIDGWIAGAGVGHEVITYYEHDGSELNQRVVYLPSEEDAPTLPEEEASQCPT